jgi:hypothetical protein
MQKEPGACMACIGSLQGNTTPNIMKTSPKCYSLQAQQIKKIQMSTKWIQPLTKEILIMYTNN